jgi:hypothetical protein
LAKEETKQEEVTKQETPAPENETVVEEPKAESEGSSGAKDDVKSEDQP